jgi:hypothetical protein
MESKNIAMLIAAFVMIILGVSLIGTVASEGQTKTTLKTISGETVKATMAGQNVSETAVLTVANPPTGWKVTDCPLTGFTIKNASGTTLTVTTDYVPTLSAGTFIMKNTTATNYKSGFFNAANNYTYVSYSYCPDDYLTENWTRTIINLVPGFFALAILLIGVGLAIGVLRNEGILNI